MKSCIIICVFSFATFTCYSQTIIQSELPGRICIGIENPIKLNKKLLTLNSLSLSVSVGSINKKESGEYVWRVCDTTLKTAVLKVYSSNDLVDTFNFQLLVLPEPTITIGNDLESSQGLRAEIENFIYEGIPMKVDRFTVYVIKEGGDYKRVVNIGAAYSAETRSIFKTLRKGDKIIFSDIYVYVGCLTRRLLSRSYSRIYSGKSNFVEY